MSQLITDMNALAAAGESRMSQPSNDIRGIAAACHAAAVRGGWWHDPATGEPVRVNVPTKLMLIVSELSEAMEGDRKGLMDDKLPHRPMLEVELADAVIRIFDLAGKMELDVAGAIIARTGGYSNVYDIAKQCHVTALLSDEWADPDACVPSKLMEIVSDTADAWKAYKQGRRPELSAGITGALASAVTGIFGLAVHYNHDVAAAMVEKMAYNASRADHKAESRVAEGGKKY